MAHGFARIPDSGNYVLANATVPAVLVDGSVGLPDGEGLVQADITVEDARVTSVTAPSGPNGIPRLDLDGGMAWPCFVDLHTHLDKGHIWRRSATPGGTFADAIAAVRKDRSERWKPDDLRARIDFSLRSAFAHGTGMIRTHVDSDAPQHRISWPVIAEMRERWAGRIDLQAVSIFEIEAFLDPDFADEIVDIVAEHGGILGAFVYPTPDLDRAIELMMHRAANRNLDLDFHVDESGDPNAHGLRVIADAALRTDFPGTVVAGHCCSLAVQPDAEAEATMDRVAEADIAVVSLPMCNVHLQDRAVDATPRWRGVTLVHELAARGVRVSVASDNTRDPFYDYGDLDMLEVFREAVRILHLDHPMGKWPAAVARTPAAVMGDDGGGTIAAEAPADLVLFRARDYTELLSRPQSDRTVIRAGRAIDTTLPDYRELDHLQERR